MSSFTEMFDKHYDREIFRGPIQKISRDQQLDIKLAMEWVHECYQSKTYIVALFMIYLCDASLYCSVDGDALIFSGYTLMINLDAIRRIYTYIFSDCQANPAKYPTNPTPNIHPNPNPNPISTPTPTPKL